MIKGLGAIDAHIRRRIRAIIVRQRKRPEPDMRAAT
jgi:hypothetical protein